jgi:hypothetical protein
MRFLKNGLEEAAEFALLELIFRPKNHDDDDMMLVSPLASLLVDPTAHLSLLYNAMVWF